MLEGDLGEVRRLVTLCTLSSPAAALPAACLPSRIREFSLLDLCAQLELGAPDVSVYVPTNSTDAEDQLAYGI